MKKFFVGVLAIAGLVACAQEEVLRTQAPGQIGFDNVYVDNAVRALQGENAADETTKTANLQSFDVWGYMDDVTGVVFSREAVTGGTGNWSYNNIQYWLPGHKYQFYAVAPAQSKNVNPTLATDTYNDGLSVAFENVDGTEDLLYAKSEEIETPTKIDAQPAPVQFGFEHLLSKIKFTFVNGIENENAHIKVTNIKMTVPAKGTVALNEELKHAYVWEDLKETTILEFGNLNTEDGRVQGYNHAECEVERLTIPAAATQEYTVDFDVMLYMGDKAATDQPVHKSIKVTNILFESGKAYNLKATLDAANVTDSTLYPITFEATVDEWVEDDPYEKDITTTVYTNEDLKNRLISSSTTINVILGDNLSYDVAAWQNLAMGGARTQDIIIDLNGKTLTFNQTNSDWNNITTNGAKLTIKNGKITSTGYNDGPWNRHDLNFACPVELIDVVSDKALALKNDATLTNVTISDANTSDTYAIWVQPNGQTVTLNKCEIDMTPASDGRGIKIDEQYVSAPEKVTLNVTDVTFKTEEKSAILVKSVAGAEINISNVDITAVAADTTFHVWVDEDAKAHAGKVIVNGGLCKVENAATATVSTADDLCAALKANENVVLTDDVTIDPAVSSNGYGITGVTVNPGQVFDGNGHVFEVDGAGGTWDSGICAMGGTIKNITVTGSFRGIFIKNNTEKVVLHNVTTTGTTYTISCDQGSGGGLEAYDCTFLGWTSYAATIGNVKFVGCHFGYGSGYKYCRPYAPTEFVNCDFEDGFTVDARATISFENCTYAGAPVTADNLSTFVKNASKATVK